MGGRLDCQRYRDLPEEYRTTFVVGMIEMLAGLDSHFDAGAQAAVGPLLTQTRLLTGNDLRLEFDRYLDEGRNREQNGAAASSFLAMLLEKRYTADRT